MKTNFTFAITSGIAAAFVSTIALTTNALAQEDELALEEIIVTAQRREQTLQEVPISLEAITGLELQEQGFRTMDDLADFSPSIEIDNRVQDQDISIRGFGTTGNNLTLEQGAPTFVDGIVFGRTSMVKGAFLDLERIEVLRGPQPVFFGQNATSGAFSLVTRKPTAEWQGNVTAEAGNFGRMSIEGGVGGPLSDTVGIRVAGRYDYLEGYLKDVITREDFPEREDKAGRITLRWTPTEAFMATAKVQISDSYIGAEPVGICLGAGLDTWQEQRDEFPRDSGERVPQGIDALVPGRTSFDDVLNLMTIPPCGGGTTPFERVGIRAPDAYFAPPDDISQEDARGSGFIDTREVVRQMRMERYGRDVSGFDEFETTHGLLDLSYVFANGIQINSLSAYIDYDRTYNRNNSNSPFLGNMRQRSEDLQQASQELRVSSPIGERFEWMFGVYWQDNDLDLLSDNFRANLRRPRRYNVSWEDAEWLSAFGTVTFNFMDDKASIDIGARYTDIEKVGYIRGYGARWVFADMPNPNADSRGRPFEFEAAVTTDGEPGYALEWREREIPQNWVTPIGITPLDGTIRRNPGPYQDIFEDTHFDPQISFRYRPTDDVSTYFKWAQASKAGGFDTGVGSLPDDPDQFTFLPEQAESWELGAKWAFWDGRARLDTALFWMEVDDLQIATTVVDVAGTGFSQGSASTNAGLQRVRGLEFTLDAALTENLLLRFAGAIMDGEMVEYGGAGCTEVEFLNADTGPCISEEESEALIGDDDLEGLIDRSGADAPRTPDWKFAIKLDYSRPFSDNLEFLGGMNLSLSDEYITNVEDFDLVQKAGKHEDLNLYIGIGDADGRWMVKAWARNILEVQEEYNGELDLEADGIVTDSLSPSNFMTYGLQFQYNYN
jgi:outer membrane receptor protein involved in Fe transport